MSPMPAGNDAEPATARPTLTAVSDDAGEDVVPGIHKPLPGDQFIAHATSAEMRMEAQGDGDLTPVERFFVRNQSNTPVLDPATYALKVWGPGVHDAVSFTYDDLLRAADTRVVRAIECAGNGRAFFSQGGGPTPPGSQWHLGGIGVAEWTGVPLGEVLERARLRRRAIEVMPVGLDDLRVRRPIPIATAQQPDTLVAIAMNGEPLLPDHGFPARIIVPGWAGIASIKWVGEILVSDRPLSCPWTSERYVLKGPVYQTALDPLGEVIKTQGVKAALELSFPGRVPAGPGTLRGRAWSGLGAIEGVDVRIDDESLWCPARLEGTNEPRAWTRWAFDWAPTAGEHVVRARARDDHGRVQPLEVPWNDLGYMYDGVVDHPVTVA